MTSRTVSISLCSAAAFAALAVVSCTTTQSLPGPGVKNVTAYEEESFVELPEGGNRLAPDKKEKYFDARRMSSNVRQRCVEGSLTATHRCGQSIPVRITAVEGAKHVSATRAPRFPQLIAWLENLSPIHTTFDSLKPGSQARYALVVTTTLGDTKRGRKPKMVLIEFDLYRNVVATHERDHVFECHNYGGSPFESEADFRPCTVSLTSVAQTAPFKSLVRMASLSAPVALYYEDDPTWFSCASGCCTSGDHGVQ